MVDKALIVDGVLDVWGNEELVVETTRWQPEERIDGGLMVTIRPQSPPASQR